MKEEKTHINPMFIQGVQMVKIQRGEVYLSKSGGFKEGVNIEGDYYAPMNDLWQPIKIENQPLNGY